MKQVSFQDIFNSDNRKQRLKIINVDGVTQIGQFFGQTDAFDNDPEIDSFEIKSDDGFIYSFYESDIKTIELID
ncbi:hypothetical protein LIX87_02720 [Weissella viridescens]|uniref:hypothetical protein n=1 Tax=Weissella viridescens TaxID=1629 RepID=UPI001D0877BD|nr:hypothetical protein [Weissella viridescens]MCB6839933.1 hypothetical protein [Weissella viridescens]MCB6846665.1 hypothetical protein [Weissella viridescens]